MDIFRAYLRQPVNWIIPLIILSTLYYPFIKWLLCLHETIEVIQAYGIFAAVISGLAFIAFLDATRLQRIQLEKQAEEIQLQRDDLKVQHELLEQTIQESREQNRTIALQRFENTFFNLLKNSLAGLEYVYMEPNRGQGGAKGKSAFKFIYDSQHDLWKSIAEHAIDPENPISMDRYLQHERYPKIRQSTYRAFSSTLKNQFFNLNQNYLETLLSCVHLIKRHTPILQSEYDEYYQILLAQLSIYEKWALFIYIDSTNHPLRSHLRSIKFFRDLTKLNFVDPEIFYQFQTIGGTED